MLPGDDQVVSRDRGLVALRLVLDDTALTAHLQALWPGHLPRPERVQATYLRYKRATQVLAAVDVEVEGETRLGLLAATSEASAVKLDKLRRYASRRPGRLPLIADPSLPLVLAPVEADRRLPGCHGLADRVCDLDPLLTGARLHVLGYKPHRRLVARVDVDGEPRALVKVHRRSAVPAVTAALKWASRVEGDLPLPRMLAADRKHGVVLTTWTLGHSLDEESPDRQRATLRAVGKILGRLHRRNVAGLPARHDSADPIPAVAQLRPELAGMTTRILRSPTSESLLTPVHGDLSADQVVHGPAGVALIDLDRSGAGDPAADLASWLAAALVDGRPDLAPDLRLPDALLEGYLGVDGPATEAEVAARLPLQILRRAADPFRRRQPDWYDRMGQLVQLAAAAVPARGSP